MFEFQEKRKHPRIRASVPLRYKELGGKSYLSKGALTKDLSEGGVRFNSDKFISLACHLVVEMSFPSIAQPVKTISKIAWIRKLPAGDSYEVGNQFLAMSSEDERALSLYTDRMLDKKV